MLKTILHILIIGIIFSSCKTENEKLTGHWHEFPAQSKNTEFRQCFIITDTSFAVNRFAMGGDFKKSDYEDENFWISTYYPKDLITKRKVKKNEVFFGDTIVWKRQKDNLKTFISDFSAGLKINVTPFETDNIEFEVLQPEKISYYIYIGLAKKEFINKSNEIIEGKYYLQLNDRITTKADLRNYLYCHHCSNKNIMNVFIHADQNVPNSYIKKIEAEISKLGIDIKEQIYYLYMNKAQRKVGYKKTISN